MNLVPIDGEPGVFRALDSNGRSLGKCRKGENGVVIMLGRVERHDKKIGIRKGKRKSNRDPHNVIGAWKRARREDLFTKAGLPVPSLWPALVVVIRTGPGQDGEECTRIDGSAAYYARKTFFHFCKKHAITHKPVERDCYPIGGELWPWSMAIEVSGGPALEKLCGDGVIPPWWLLDWYYVVDSSPPMLGSGGVSAHGPRPINKERGFKYDEVARHEYDVGMDEKKNPVYVKTPPRLLCEKCTWDELSAEQREGLVKERVVKMEWLEKRVFGRKDVWILHLWSLGCVKPMKWSNQMRKWVECD